MESTRVIKVKYGGTLRRFTARVNENNHLDLDMAGLRAKILSLFNLTPDANLVLKYVDEDGDLVTLVDDDDLRDAMKQRLKFLRIDVHIRSDNGGKSNSSSSGGATPLRSPHAPNPSRGVEVILAPDALKSVPEPLREAVSRLTTESLSYGPVAANIADFIVKMGMSVPNPHGWAHAAAGPSSKNGVPEKSSSSEAGSPRSAPQPIEAETVTKGVPLVISSIDGKFMTEPMRDSLHKLAKSESRATYGDPTSDASQLVEAENATRAIPVVIAPDALKFVPEPLRDSVSKLMSALLSSSPVVAKLVDSASKTALTLLNSHGQAHAAAGPSSKNGVPEESSSSEARGPSSACGDSTSNANRKLEAEKVPGAVPVVIASDSLKSVPEPLREAVSKFTTDLLSYGPVAANLADSVSKMGIPSPYFQAHVSAGVSSQNGVPKVSASSEARVPQATCVGSTSNAGQQVGAGNVTSGVVAGVAPVDLNILPGDPYSSQSTNVNAAPISPVVPDGHGKKGKKRTDDSLTGKGKSSGTSPNSAVPNYMQQAQMNQFQMLQRPEVFNFPPFSRMAVDFVPPIGKQFIRPVKRSPNPTEASGMFHKGVRCDSCGVYPITGPRFKSKVKEDYDLCSICFNKMGNESDYIKMDRPVSCGPRCSTAVCEQPPVMGSPTLPHVFKADAMFKDAMMKHARPKLDSRFVLDVNVIDGTMMAPSTAFTKIWRMRNNGTLVWPKGTQLVWIGGDQFSEACSVYLEVPEEGVPVDKELDIAVDFRAPQLPGRYVSYWRMAFPSGQRFGQRVWVLIQVDASLKDSFYDSSQGLNLNIPLDVSGSGGPQIIDINAQPIEDGALLQHLNPDATTEPVNQMADKQPRRELENDLPVDEATVVVPAASASATSAAPSPVSYPIIDLSETAPAVPSDQQSSAVHTQSSSFRVGGNNSVEETLLKELEDMGFKQVDLNKEILRMNEYNLEQSVDDLCGVSEWDPILEELQEMGFRDNEKNKRLLKKNNGSIKRVVMDLINGGE